MTDQDEFDQDEFDQDEFDQDEFDPDVAGTRVFEYSATVAPGDAGMATLLREGGIEVLGRMPWSSNGTYLVEVRVGDDHAPGIYKPLAGERPLWDFPDGLWRREVAASVLSDALGWGLVPPTVARSDGPLGEGSLQAFVPARYEEHFFTIRDDPDHGDVLRRLCAFDLVANSADRKGGHCLLDGEGRVWGIDNGLTFHEEFKVRTVIWDYAGEAVPDRLREDLDRFVGRALPEDLVTLLSRPEREALVTRAGALLAGGRFPHDPSGRRYPWPLV